MISPSMETGWAYSRAMRRVAETIDGWITPSRLRGYPIVFLIGSVVGLVVAALRPHPLPDFLAHWTGGRMLLDGSTGSLYDPTAQQAVQTGLTDDGALSWFVSPPFATYLYAPFAALDYTLAAILWTVVSMGCMAAAVWLMQPLAPRLFAKHRTLTIVALASTQPVFETLGAGQDAGVSALIWVAGIRLGLAGKDAAGGAVLALGLMKPQLFFAVPFVLIAQRKWRGLGAWAATACGLGLISVKTVGVDGVIDWIRLPFSPVFHEVVQTGQAWKMQSLPALATSLGAWAWIGTAIALLGFGVLLWQLWANRAAEQVYPWMLAIIATIAISPHVVIYDLVIALVPIVWLVDRHNVRAVRLACLLLFALTWTVALRHIVGVPVLGAAWSALPLAALWVLMARSEVRRDHDEAVAPEPARPRVADAVS